MPSLREEWVRLRRALRALRRLERSPADETLWALEVRRAKVAIWCMLDRRRLRGSLSVGESLAPQQVMSSDRTLVAALNLQSHLESRGLPARLETGRQSSLRSSALVCPQVFDPKEEYSTAFQLEQLRCSAWLAPFYLRQLARADRVVDFSDENVELLQELGFDEERIERLELKPVRKDLLLGETDLSGGPEAESFLLFYGAMSDRRQAALSELVREVPTLVVNDLSREALWKLVDASRAVVNVHFYPCSSTEAVRITEVLTIGTPVISEDAADLASYSWSHLVDVFPKGDWGSLNIKAQEALRIDRSMARRAEIREWIQGHLGE